MKNCLAGISTAFVGAVLMMSLSGCGNAIPDMTEEQQSMVTEYAAQLLLKYDANYQNTILTEEQSLEAEEELIRDAELALLVQEQQAMQQAAVGNQNDGGREDSSEPGEPVYTDMDSFLGLSGSVEIEYAGYLVCDSYPVSTEGNDWQGVARATSSNSKLVVFTFTLKNVSGSDYELNMASLGAKFNFRINGNITKASLTTLLNNDLMMYRDTIPAGEAIDAVLLIEMPAADTENFTSIKMTMKLGDSRAETTLL
ncbi:MAG: hypothetical protein K2K17_11905 [Lachnospiraceae bacterium]|nr:hypothetical protein [Lachnospiraceae bacterium]